MGAKFNAMKKSDTTVISDSSKNRGPSVTKQKKDRGDSSECTSKTPSTQFFKENKIKQQYVRITRMEYLSESESISGSSDTFHCVHGPEGKIYTTAKAQLKRNFMKCLDPVPKDSTWTEICPPAYDWDMAKKLEFLVNDPVGRHLERFHEHLEDFVKISSNGYKLKLLDSISVILNHLADNTRDVNLKKYLTLLLKNVGKPIILDASSDVTTNFNVLQNYIGFLGYLLLVLEDDNDFEILSEALKWHLTASDKIRKAGTVRLNYTLAAAAPVLIQTMSRMLAISRPGRFRAFAAISLILACHSPENCIGLIEENIIEHILYRYNPFFPFKSLPTYEIGPIDPNDFPVKLGDSTVHSQVILSLLLVLLKCAKDHLKLNPKTKYPLPDPYSIKCFAWAFRYECIARDHRHERNTMTVIAMSLLHCYGEQLYTLPQVMMADVVALSVLTEMPFASGWIKKISFNTSQVDVHFKKLLIYFSVQFFKTFPRNNFMMESKYWLMGLIYLLDPALTPLRAKWSPALFGELCKTSMQALVSVMPLVPKRMIKEYGLIRRLMWYIEWYSPNPYHLTILYWTLRVLHSCIRKRKTQEREDGLKDLFQTHGVVVITYLCYTLLNQKIVPIEKCQSILSLCLRLLTSAVEREANVKCVVYPGLEWPECIKGIAIKMLNVAVYGLEKSYVITERWLVSLLNFIWEAVIWNDKYRKTFIAMNGIYKLLDLLVMTRETTQCITLALLCDLAKSGEAVGQLISWRTKLEASSYLVKRSATIGSLLASIFRDECRINGILLDDNNVIQDVDNPLMTAEVRKIIDRKYPREMLSRQTPVSCTYSDLAGARMPKVFALLFLLSEDLEYKVSLADEAYKLYKNIELSCEEEVILVLCIHYLTVKLNETWSESKFLLYELEQDDADVFTEFLHIGKGWGKEIKFQQEQVIKRHNKKEKEEETSLYSFLDRVRLNIALDALQEVRCIARTADRMILMHSMIHDAVKAHHRRSTISGKMDTAILRTYKPRLDEQNLIGQNVKIINK